VGGEPTLFYVYASGFDTTEGGPLPSDGRTDHAIDHVVGHVVDNVIERARAIAAPALEGTDLQLFDVERTGKAGSTVLRVLIDRPGGVDLDAISEATRRISDALDRDPEFDSALSGRYLLEVSSPGVERPLRTPAHFGGAVGSTVVVKTHPGTAGERRVEGILESAGSDGIVVAGRSIPYADIERARTRFVWPEPRKAGARP
jgi:ribosome maturation factor RimP